MALPIENSAWFDDQTRRMDFPSDYTLRLDFHPASCEYDAIEFAGNYDMISLDLPLHSGSFTENQAVTGNHIPLYMRVDAEHTSGLERPFKSHALVKEPRKFVLLLVLATIF
jgi:hypothetical protein